MNIIYYLYYISTLLKIIIKNYIVQIFSTASFNSVYLKDQIFQHSRMWFDFINNTSNVALQFINCYWFIGADPRFNVTQGVSHDFGG